MKAITWIFWWGSLPLLKRYLSGPPTFQLVVSYRDSKLLCRRNDWQLKELLRLLVATLHPSQVTSLSLGAARFCSLLDGHQALLPCVVAQVTWTLLSFLQLSLLALWCDDWTLALEVSLCEELQVFLLTVDASFALESNAWSSSWKSGRLWLGSRVHLCWSSGP